MTDISVTSKEFGSDPRAWLLTELVGHQQSTPTTHGEIDFSLFTANTHYPKGFIPSGIVLGRVTTGGRLGPYGNGLSDGRETAVGFLYNAIQVPANLATRMAVAVVDCFAVIWVPRLPANHGLDTAARADLSLIKFRA